MTLEEKIEHFTRYTMEEAQKNRDSELDTYRMALEKTFKEHKETKIRMEELELKTESDRIVRENNKRYSREQIQMRQMLREHQSVLKDKLFEEVKSDLQEFCKTPAYKELLIKELKEALAFAHGEKVILYIDPADAGHILGLEAQVGAPVTVSGYSFMGGMRAVIPGRNILIDNSFQTRFEEAKEKFRLKGGCRDGE